MKNDVNGHQMSIDEWLQDQSFPTEGTVTKTFSNSNAHTHVYEKQEIGDFGEKIGGARKDLWDNPDTILAGDVKKNDIWKKPDYQALYECGRPRELCWFIKRLYDAIPREPKIPAWTSVQDRNNILSLYMDMVAGLERKTMSLTDLSDIAGMKGFLEDEGLIEIRYGRYRPLCGSEAFISTRLVNTLRMNPARVKTEAAKKRFLYTEDEKLLANYSFTEITKETEVRDDPRSPGRLEIIVPHSCFGSKIREYFYAYPSNKTAADKAAYREGTWFISRCRRVDMCGFRTKEEAQQYILGTARMSTAANKPAPGKARKKAFKLPHLEHVIRTGGDDYREGKDVTGEDYLDVFHFRGGEFGNWLSQGERQEVLNQGYDALMDMSRVLGISPAYIAGDGKLGIAFGARGRGHALAHFEPERCVINITRMRGAGSLGHEMIHFFDYFIGRELGLPSYLTSGISMSPESFRELMEAIKGTPHQRTQFYKDACSIDESYSKSGKGYWNSDVELLARAGAAWLKDRLKEAGIRNDYLCGHADAVIIESFSDDKGTIYGAPQGDERKKIDEKFDEFFSDMKARKILG